METAAEYDSAATPPSIGSRRWQRLTERRPLRLGAVAAALLLLFLVYNHLGAQLVHNSDNAEIVLASQDILRGNWNLHGWTLGPDNEWTLDQGFYTVAMAFRGATPALMHEVPAALFAILIACTVWLTRLGRENPVTIPGELLPFSLLGILAYTTLNDFTVLALQGYHVLTTAAGCLICVGLLQPIATETVRTGRSARIRLSAVALIMTMLLFADPFTNIMLTLPLLTVATVGLARKGPSMGNLAIWGVVIAGVALTFALRLVMKWTGGFTMTMIAPDFTDYRNLYSNIALTIHSLLMVCGADFFGRDVVSLVTMALLIRFGALVFLVWCIYRTLRRFAAGNDSDWIATVLSIGCALDIGACVFSTPFSVFGIWVARYTAPVIVLGAVVAGRTVSSTPPAYRRLAGAALALLFVASVGLCGTWKRASRVAISGTGEGARKAGATPRIWHLLECRHCDG